MTLIDRAKNIIITPVKEWNVIALETPDIAKILTGYVLPLAAASAAASFIGYGFIGVNYFGIRVAGVNWGLYYAITILVTAFVSVFISAFVIDALAPSFGSEKNLPRSVQLVAYSFTPTWVGGLLSIFPPIAFLGAIFAIYGLYLLYLGMPKLKNTPSDKSVGYFVVSLIVIIVVYYVIGLILTRVMMSSMGLSYGAPTFNLNY